jgi:hypothetical protein
MSAYLDDDTHRGASRGLGFEVARQLVADVILTAVRTVDRVTAGAQG